MVTATLFRAEPVADEVYMLVTKSVEGLGFLTFGKPTPLSSEETDLFYSLPQFLPTGNCLGQLGWRKRTSDNIKGFLTP